MTGAPDNAERVAVVTGGSSGIGLATVRSLLAGGCRVAFLASHEHHVSQAVANLRKDFGEDRVLGRCIDLRLPTAISTFFDLVTTEWGSQDILVCNAGISPKGPDGATPFHGLTLDEWNDVLNVNLTGVMLCCQAVLPAMKRRQFGRIILVGSIAGRTTPRIAGPAYVASKAALAGLSRSILAACNGTGVTVNLVSPGRILTEMAGPPDSEDNCKALQRIPVGRLGTVQDVAHVIHFLSSPQAGFINGAIIDVNGGEFAPL